jgi:hypothetical protein
MIAVRLSTCKTISCRKRQWMLDIAAAQAAKSSDKIDPSRMSP